MHTRFSHINSYFHFLFSREYFSRQTQLSSMHEKSPAGLNSIFDPCILLIFQILAIQAIVFCHFTLQSSQMAIPTPIFCYFPQK